MKRVKYILTLVISLFILTFTVNAESSNFEPFIEMYTDITENQIKITLGFSGEEIMTIKETISYDSRKLTLARVDAKDNFTVTSSVEKEDGKYRTLTLLADSDYSFTESYYATLVFDVSTNFKIKQKSDLFFYDFTASGPDKIMFRSSGIISTLNRVSVSEMNGVISLIDKNTKTKYWFIENYYIFIIALAFIVMIVVIIFLIPSRRKKEKRDQNFQNSVKAENYDPNVSTIKVDPEVIEKIGVVEKEVDMKEAIIVNEDVKPFGDIVARSDDFIEIKDEIPNNNLNNVNVFEQRQPELFENNVMQTTNEVTPENKENLTSVNIDAFNQTPLATNNVAQDLTTVNQVTTEQLIPSSVIGTNLGTSEQNVNNVTVPENNVNPSSNNNINTPNNNLFSVIVLFILTLASVTYINVFAADYQVDLIRQNIVEKYAYNKSLDLNNDGVIDVLDIIETKDLTNCNFQNLVQTDPGFAEIHKQSNNIISSANSNGNTVSSRTSTTKKTTTKKTTTKKKSTGNGTTNAGTTKKTTVSNSTTSKTTTTKETTTKKTTTTKPTALTYNVSIQAVNGTVSSNSFMLQAGKSKSVTLNPNVGYALDKTSTNCTNIDYSFSGTNRMLLENPTGDATCNVVFVPSGGIKVILNWVQTKGNSNQQTTSGTKKSGSENNGSTGIYNTEWKVGVTLPTGYQVRAGSPSCGTYSNGVFSILVPAKNTTCTLYFDPILYSISVYAPGQSSPVNPGALANIYYDETKTINFQLGTVYSSVTCTAGGVTQTPSLSKKSSDGLYTYSFKYTHTAAGNVTCNLS